MMKKLIAVILFGICIIIVAGLVFYLNIGKGLSISSNDQNWAAFGNYYGGVTGPLLSFLSVILIVFTFNQQEQQIEKARQESLKIEFLRYVSTANEELERWLQKKLTSVKDNKEVELGDIVWGIVKSDNANQQEFTSAMIRLHKLTCSYCQSITLYQDNFDTFLEIGHHRRRALDLLNFLENHLSVLEQMAAPSLDLCRKGIMGEFN